MMPQMAGGTEPTVQRSKMTGLLGCAVGGYMGYKKKGSTASLKASGGFAAVLVLAGYLIGGPYNAIGLGLALGEQLPASFQLST